MKVTIKSPRANKRKIVVPFAGEENFIVPKQGGYGQPDNDEWISIESKYANLTAPLVQGGTSSSEPPIGQGLPTGTGQNPENPNYNTAGSTTGSVLTGTQIGGLAHGTTGSTLDNTTLQCADGSTPRNGICPVVCQSGETLVNGVCVPYTPPTCAAGETLILGVCTPITQTPTSCPSGQEMINGVCTPISTPPPAETTCPSGQQMVNGVCKPINIVTESTTTTPTFPDYSTMDCANLTSEIASLNFKINSGNLSTTEATAYNNALATAKSTYTSKCSSTSTTSQPAIALIPTSPALTSGGGGGFGGGGGGGLGEPPADSTNITEETTNVSSGKSWLLILAIIGGIYFLTKSSK